MAHGAAEEGRKEDKVCWGAGRGAQGAGPRKGGRMEAAEKHEKRENGARV